jgi:ribosome-binding ATPase YchF (GTP1/OBG family)/predicted esterase
VRTRILCLHGGQQTGELLRQRLERFCQRCRAASIELVFADAPVLLPDGTRLWYSEEGGNDAASALDAVSAAWTDLGPFVGLLGFSQGAAIAAAVALSPFRLAGLRFVILAGSPDPPSLADCDYPFPFLGVASLHIMSDNDELVPSSTSRRVAERFIDAEFLAHDKGHALPCRAVDIDVYLGFIARHTAHIRAVSDGAAAVGRARHTRDSTPAEAERPPWEQRSGRTEADQEVRESDSVSDETCPLRPPDPASALLPDVSSLGISGDAGDTYRAPPSPAAASIDAPAAETIRDRASRLAAWCEEMQAAEAIFGADLAFDAGSLDCEQLQAAADAATSEVAGAPAGAATSSPPSPVSFSILLGDSTTPDMLKPPSELRLTFRLLPSYPSGGCGSLELGLAHQMLAHNFPPESGAAILLAAWRAVAEAFELSPGGGVGVWSAVNGANEAIADGRWRGGGGGGTAAGGGPAGGVGAGGGHVHGGASWASPAPKSAEEIEREEAALAAFVERLGEEAEAVMAATESAALLGAVQSEGATADGRQASLRGSWHYRIGLVGKPSAGKSTLFNALTRAGWRPGAVAAKTGAQPFITIEPNVGSAVWAAPDGAEPAQLVAERTATAHGRAANGSRLLPCTLIDIAGLVPGAYLGRGKGNLFLQELCRADVLIHVVDGSGTTDKGGNLQEASEALMASGSGGAAVIDEIGWVRAEIHLWVFTNVRHKRPTWRRRPHRLLDMFGARAITRVLCSLPHCARLPPRGLTLASQLDHCTWPAAHSPRFRARVGSVARCCGESERHTYRLPSQPTPDLQSPTPLPTPIPPVGYGSSPALVTGVLRRSRQASVAVAGGEDSGIPDDEYLARVCGGSAAADIRGASLDDPADMELHRLVAHYVATRWPVAVALNKMDVPSAALHEAAVRQRYPQRVVVPVSARAEVELLRAQAQGECEYGLGGGAHITLVGGAAATGELAQAMAVLDRWGSTGTLEVISRAVGLRPPTLAFPCSDLTSLAPLGRDAGPPLFDCLQLKPLTTIGDLYDCCKREALCAGDLVRAEVMHVGGTTAGAAVVRRDETVTSRGAVVRIQTRRASWQHKAVATDAELQERAREEKITGRRRRAG